MRRGDKVKVFRSQGIQRRLSDVVSAEGMEKIGEALNLAKDPNFRLWIANLKTWSKVKESWVSHQTKG